jgi:hypothetical protein
MFNKYMINEVGSVCVTSAYIKVLKELRCLQKNKRVSIFNK